MNKDNPEEFEISFIDNLDDGRFAELEQELAEADDSSDIYQEIEESDSDILLSEIRSLSDSLKNQGNRNDGIFNKMFSFLERLSTEVEDLQRTVYQRENIETYDISDLPEWAIDYIEKLHNLASGRIVNCKRCGDIKLDSRKCGCGQPKKRRSADPIVWDNFIDNN